MEQNRPNPDALLAQVKDHEARQQRGKLKVFFGAAAGVGKTYAMLTAGRQKATEGVDVVVGYAEPHARPETEAILLGLELLPYQFVPYRGAKLKEFDLDAAIKRKPELILVDELAHTNAPGMRHEKRWQDVEEILAAGIDVYTTLNVQHLESLNDVVAQITGVIVRETLPDAMFERADEVELVDLSPDELLERLAEGKVYVPQQADLAVQGFFKKPNLTALRELALRKTADRVSEMVLDARQAQFARKTWPTTERLLVCVSPSPSSARVIRAAKRLSVSLHAEWIAAHVETPKLRDLVPRGRDLLLRHFRLAERLGAETVTLSGLNPVDEIVSYARTRNITKIIAGKPDRPWWMDIVFQSQVDQLLRKSGEIDVYVVRGIGEADPIKTAGAEAVEETPRITWSAGINSVTVLGVCTLVACAIHYLSDLGEHGDLSNLVMIYLAGVVIVAARHGRVASAIAALVSVLLFDFLFVPPRFRFAVSDTQYLVTFLVMLAVALLIGTLTVRIRDQAEASRRRERRTEALYRMTRELSAAPNLTALIEAATRHLAEVFRGRAALLLPDTQGRLNLRAAAPAGASVRGTDEAVAQWVFEHRQPAGRGTDTLPAAEALYLPLIASGPAVGVVGIHAERTQDLLAPESRQLLDAFLNQIALGLEREQLSSQARDARVHAEAEKLRNSLLSSVSHDLRTPLAVIAGASSSLIESPPVDPEARFDLLRTIRQESTHLNELVGNLLDITRLEAGAVRVNKQWHPIEEIVGSALHRLRESIGSRAMITRIPADAPMAPVDGVLIEQVLVNLIENALKYAPADQPVEITAEAQGGVLRIGVHDRGPGIPTGEEPRVFEKFFRGSGVSAQRGSGLGLAICRAIVEIHGGRIWAENRRPPSVAGEASGPGGASFWFTLPLGEAPPPAVPEDPELPIDTTPNATTEPRP